MIRIESFRRVFLPSFLWMSRSKWPVPNSSFGVEVVCYSIWCDSWWAQVVQNWFTGIPNPPRSSILGWGCQYIIGWVRMESILNFPFCPFWRMSSSKPHSRYNFRLKLVRCSIGMVRDVIQGCPKLVYRNSESVPKFEVRIRLTGLYRMSEDGVYLSSAPSFLSGVCRVQSGPFQITF